MGCLWMARLHQNVQLAKRIAGEPCRLQCANPQTLCCIIPCTVSHCTAQYGTVLYCTVLYGTVLYSSVLLYCCTAVLLYCSVLLYCTVLYCTVMSQLSHFQVPFHVPSASLCRVLSHLMASTSHIWKSSGITLHSTSSWCSTDGVLAGLAATHELKTCWSAEVTAEIVGNKEPGSTCVPRSASYMSGMFCVHGGCVLSAFCG